MLFNMTIIRNNNTNGFG